MAQAPMTRSDSVGQFMTIAAQLIQEAVAYSGQNDPDDAAEANIRQIRTMTSALMAALQPVTRPVRMPTMPMAPAAITQPPAAAR
jgi:hypothetical protein